MYLMNSADFHHAAPLSTIVSDDDAVVMDMEYTPEGQQQQQDNDVLLATLRFLKNAWNRLDQSGDLGYFSQAKRQQYLKDMELVRRGGQTCYSLGGDDRLEFGRLYRTLSRKLQECFLQTVSRSLQENRIMNDADLQFMLLQDKGKRDTGPVPCLAPTHQEQRPSKRQRESYYWLEGIHCFE
jgi:hypothetical protein